MPRAEPPYRPLVLQRFADVARPPDDYWLAEACAPLPLAFPPKPSDPVCYYVCARSLGSNPLGPRKWSAPWARVLVAPSLQPRLELLSSALDVRGVEYAHHCSRGPNLLALQALMAAGGYEPLLQRACDDVAARIVLLRAYKAWRSQSAVARFVLAQQPWLDRLLDDVELEQPPPAEADIRARFYAEYNARFVALSKHRPGESIVPTPPLVTRSMRLAYYGFYVRIEREGEGPWPQRIWGPWARLTRESPGGTCAFELIAENPPELGVSRPPRSKAERPDIGWPPSRVEQAALSASDPDDIAAMCARWGSTHPLIVRATALLHPELLRWLPQA